MNDLRNSRAVVAADSPATWCHPDSSELLTNCRNIGTKICVYPERPAILFSAGEMRAVHCGKCFVALTASQKSPCRVTHTHISRVVCCDDCEPTTSVTLGEDYTEECERCEVRSAVLLRILQRM